MLDAYSEVLGTGAVDQIRQLAKPLAGATVVHVNSTRRGGGVAEILNKLVPLTRELDIDACWEIVTGENGFYRCTKMLHNGLQGWRVEIDEELWSVYQRTNAENAERLRDTLERADFVVIHDPQPAGMMQSLPNRQGKWIWRCHIDASRTYRPVWRRVREMVADYDASVFSLPDFAQDLPHPEYIIQPSIDPLSDKNIELAEEEVDAVCANFGLDRERPLLVQISRFDHFKDPLGVIRAYQLAKSYVPDLQLVLAGGGADDDPEGDAVYSEVVKAAAGDEDIHILLLPASSHRTINALQRAATIGVQKSTREGFGLTVTESMWKGKPVIGGDSGGIRRQIVNYHNGFLVSTPEGAALRIRYLLQDEARIGVMGATARRFVRDNFLITRHLREYLTLMLALRHKIDDRIELR